MGDVRRDLAHVGTGQPAERLAREREAHAKVARERGAESERDLHQLAELVAQITERRQEARHAG